MADAKCGPCADGRPCIVHPVGPYVAPLIKEADPELERLLAEEAEIEAEARASGIRGKSAATRQVTFDVTVRHKVRFLSTGDSILDLTRAASMLTDDTALDLTVERVDD